MEARTEERRSVVASGKTVEDAIKNGLTMLGVRRDQVDTEVISEGSRGVLGFGAENARVRLVVKLPAVPKPPSSPAVPTPPPAHEPVKAAVRPSPAEEPSPFQKEGPAPKATAPASAPQERPVLDTPKSEASEVGREVLGELLSLMGISASIEIQAGDALGEDDGPPPVVLNLSGDDLGALIGRRGETLRALQYLLRLMVSHRIKHWTNLVVDVESYRIRRFRALESLAVRVAEEVARSGRSQALEPMPPDERRIVHITLRNHPKVATHSVGEGERRKVTIIPRR